MEYLINYFLLQNYETLYRYKYDRGPHVLLTSVPSSGNTWLRYLLEKASGFFTGSIYKDKPVFEKGLLSV